MDKKIKIVYIISTLVKSGPVNVLYNIIRHIDKEKFDITIITLSPEPLEHSLFNEFEKLNINIKSLSLSRIEGYLYGGFKLQKMVNEIKPDVIHTHCFRSNLFSALFLKKYKRCSTVHSDYKVDLTKLYPGFISKIMFVINHIALLVIKNNICCSENLAKQLNKRYKYMSFNFVDNGIDTEKFKPVENKAYLRKNLGLPIDKKIWIWVGSLIERKNPLLLVDAIKKLNTDDIFIFCGDGNLYSEIKEQIKNLNNVIPTGNIDNIDEYLQASDYYISTSLSEGLPMSVLEAMSCGVPVLLSDIEQHKYVLKDDNAGIVFKINDEKDLIEKIYYILGIDYTLASKKTRDIVLQNFSSELMSEKYMQIYKNFNRE